MRLLVLVLLLSAGPAVAFDGRVVDAQGAPQAGAEVYVLGRPGEAITDEDGRFAWKPDPAPPFEVLVILRGGVHTRPVLVESLDPASVLQLTVQPLAAEAMLVSGSAPGIESTPAAGTTTLSAAEIAVRQPSNLIQALENVAGVNQVSEGQAAVPAVRGLSAGRTLVLIDGARVTSERRAGSSATFLDPAVLESVDVARGPGSVAYGSDAFGGVISVRTRRVAPGSPWGGRATGMLGGAGLPEYRLSAEVSKGVERGSFLLAAHTREAEDWESPAGEVFNSGFRDHGFLLRGEHELGRGTLAATWQGDRGRDIERPRNNSTTVRFYYPDEDSDRFTTNYELRGLGGFSRIGINGSFARYDQTTDQDRFATATTGRSIERAQISARDVALRGFVERLHRGARLEAGIDLNGRYDLNALEGRVAYDRAGNLASDVTSVAVDDADRLDSAVYASVDARLTTRLSLAGGLRGDHGTSENNGGFFGDRATSHDAASGFFAQTAGSFGGFSATVQAARGFRDPTLSDRYFRGPTGRGFITGNPDLNPETSRQFDLALRYAAGRFRVAGFYYHYRIDDLIERYQDQTDLFFFRNRGEARVEGIEIEAQADLGHGVTLELAGQLADGEARGEALEDRSHLDGIAPFTVSVLVRRRFGERAFAQLRVATYAQDDDPGPTERVVPGYTLVDVAGGYAVARPLELRVVARNLLDEEYLASQDVRAVPAPGRSVALVAAVTF